VLLLLAAGVVACGLVGADGHRREDAAVAASQATPAPRTVRQRLRSEHLDPLVEDLQERSFRYFWDLANPANGLVPDRWPTPSFASVAAVGFGLTAYPIGVERGWITREQARERVLATLRFFATAVQGSGPVGNTGYRGFLYHFLDMDSGVRFKQVELSTIDTALFLAGALVCQSYFDGSDTGETEIRSLAETLYERAEWTWMQPRPPGVIMGWTPEGGYLPLNWRGYDEAMILYILALGSPTYPIEASAWPAWTSTYPWGEFYGQHYVGFAPLFGHQFSELWVDFRGIQDDYMRARGIDYFENSRRAVLAQRGYAVADPAGFAGYGENVWGLTACDGPADLVTEIGGRQVRFFSYAARGACFTEIRDDGTVAPYAAAASIPFAPELAIAAVHEMHARYGDLLWSTYGFLDAFNPTFTFADVRLAGGRVVPGAGWFDTDYLGIDEGPIVAMIENYRNGFVWRVMRTNPAIVRGLRRAGFTGGWLDSTAAAPGEHGARRQ
jgi:hypothetical protein